MRIAKLGTLAVRLCFLLLAGFTWSVAVVWAEDRPDRLPTWRGGLLRREAF